MKIIEGKTYEDGSITINFMEDDKKIGHGYKDDEGKICLIKCPKCFQENYAMAVSSGVCAWCGYETNS